LKTIKKSPLKRNEVQQILTPTPKGAILHAK